MTDKEIEMQLALGTLDPQKLSFDEFNYYISIIARIAIAATK
ncbi:hypothetical protein LCGC14_1461440 [marine sediment metagenome]|uniref:Uncharacterized protein n=1 Tax=marine sediment metagenome TaxID=412755 RepID=A0A0F9JFK6_9ZZZZ